VCALRWPRRGALSVDAFPFVAPFAADWRQNPLMLMPSRITHVELRQAMDPVVAKGYAVVGCEWRAAARISRKSAIEDGRHALPLGREEAVGQAEQV